MTARKTVRWTSQGSGDHGAGRAAAGGVARADGK